MKKLIPLLAIVAFSVACGGASPQPASPDDKNASGTTTTDSAKDGDGDGVPDNADKCPDKKEDGQAPDPKDGCPKQ
ncbi:MAG TPA: hypothetical protein VIF62_01120 [Labilithrix sp.]|jgi:hypothetical protein